MKSSLITSTLVLLALSTLAAASLNSKEYHKHVVAIDIDQEDANYYLQGMQGFWIGYQEGFYKNKKELSEQCFDDATLDNIMVVVDFLGHPDAKDTFKFFYSAVAVSKNFQACAV